MTTHKTDLPHSSSISCVEYNDETKDMHITFASGGKHCFKDVDKEHYDNMTSPQQQSVGKYFHLNIRKKHISEKVD